MGIFSYTREGYDGHVITVEVDVRNGIPNTMIVGLAGHAIQEAKERVRVSLKNSGFVYPDSRVVINLSPASLPKSGTLFDVAIACALLLHTEQIPAIDCDIMLLGELHLDGSVGGVAGVISAIHEGLLHGIRTCMVPDQNDREARALDTGIIISIGNLRQLRHLSHDIAAARIAADRPAAIAAPDRPAHSVVSVSAANHAADGSPPTALLLKAPPPLPIAARCRAAATVSITYWRTRS